jgi:hypothetical protein
MHKIKSTEKPTATQIVFALIQPTIVSNDKFILCGSELAVAYSFSNLFDCDWAWPGKKYLVGFIMYYDFHKFL